jgi:hypothetical protein
MNTSCGITRCPIELLATISDFGVLAAEQCAGGLVGSAMANEPAKMLPKWVSITSCD